MARSQSHGEGKAREESLRSSLHLAIASDMAREAIEVEEHSADEKHEKNTDEKQNSDEERDDDKKPVIVDVVEGVVHDLDEEDETNGGKGEKRSNGDVASAVDDREWRRSQDAKH